MPYEDSDPLLALGAEDVGAGSETITVQESYAVAAAILRARRKSLLGLT
jgi:hypothetical protein